MVRRAAVKRFGTIPAGLETRITEADKNELTALFDRALAAVGIDEV